MCIRDRVVILVAIVFILSIVVCRQCWLLLPKSKVTRVIREKIVDDPAPACNDKPTTDVRRDASSSGVNWSRVANLAQCPSGYELPIDVALMAEVYVTRTGARLHLSRDCIFECEHIRFKIPMLDNVLFPWCGKCAGPARRGLHRKISKSD